MSRKVPLNTRFNRGVPERAYIKHLHVYTEGEITEKEYLDAFCRAIIPCHPEFRLSIKPSKGKSSPRNILTTIRRDTKMFGDKTSNEIWVLIDQDDWPASHVESLKEGKGIRQAVEARHQSHVLNEARHASDGKAPHEVRKVEERQ